MTLEPWIGDESHLASVLRRVFVRALRRPAVLIAAALVITGSYVTYRTLRSPSYEATMYFRLVEGDFHDPHNSPRPPRAIREYISNVALSLSRAEEIMTKYDRANPDLAHDRIAAINAFRDEIKIDVSRNYFIYDRDSDDAPRSAQVSISLSGPDRERTRAALHAIADAILADQVAQRSGRLAQAREFLDARLAVARARAKGLRDELDRMPHDVRRPDTAAVTETRARAAALQVEAAVAMTQVLALERRAADVQFSAAAEGEHLALKFELFDETLETTASRLTIPQLARRALVVFAFALVLTMPVSGAFDDRIYAPDDLFARGLPMFGALPRFPGDDAGSYAARTSAKVA